MIQVQLNKKNNFPKKQIITRKYIEQKVLEEDFTTLEYSILETKLDNNIFETTLSMNYEFNDYKLEPLKKHRENIWFKKIILN